MNVLCEPLYPDVHPTSWELDLIQSTYLRRLKHLAHYGAGSFVSPVTHSRFEHTIGFWKLAAYFFPEDHVLRASALLHDVGHLPFSHAVERTLGYNHHQLTIKYIQSKDISHRLKKADISIDDVCHLLTNQSPLTGTDVILGLDHLDSFFRDTYMMGDLNKKPAEMLTKLTCTEKGISTDQKTAEWLLSIIVRDHTYMHSPMLKAADRLLSEAVHLHWFSVKEDFSFLIDAQVTAQLIHSSNAKARSIIQALLFEPSRIRVSENITGKGLTVPKGKVYLKLPLVNEEEIIHSEQASTFGSELESLLKEYEVFIK
ncbi:HD domain-containing protein [Alkalicoccobacillus murimartini]|uniref:HD superfamily phosphohydrolase n=1 Tax=Alkalicoccobacillus murimartini TaxID=171685 RepID=A0ABT9YDT7_9BACI|nr:HD domain-containing protein [Alkalicoccobacillus murimartini]MDQ0205362.1 HD superfamily phosphohydrolase [Alkalicoccobacillus murimartini]